MEKWGPPSPARRFSNPHAARLSGYEQLAKQKGEERRELRLALREQLRRLVKQVEVYPEEKTVLIFNSTGQAREIVRDENGSIYTVDVK